MNGPDSLTRMTTNLLALSDVRRWGVIKTMRTQSVAEHSFNVMVIAAELMTRCGLTSTVQLAQMYGWAMIHDMPECLSGDIDGKFKRDNPALKEMITVAEGKHFPDYVVLAKSVPPYISTIVKVADKIEAITFIKVWGVGDRAVDVVEELEGVLYNEWCQKMVDVCSSTIGTKWVGTVAGMRSVCTQIISNIVSETGSIQFDRRR